MGNAEIEAFLTHAVEGRVFALIQNQTLSALLLYITIANGKRDGNLLI